MLGRFEDGRFTLEEMHRFTSAAVRVLGSLRWDVLRIFEELKAGLRNVARRHVPVASLSVDSWGVDYVTPDRAGARPTKAKAPTSLKRIENSRAKSYFSVFQLAAASQSFYKKT